MNHTTIIWVIQKSWSHGPNQTNYLEEQLSYAKLNFNPESCSEETIS